ncbi:helix-turn-helix domain-containing protein [Lewinella sp. IMCC34183]|uniref:helix-turn-helix domain-containing protein n=1 Tax=Lewinella sp. IMCC34183 TaxID=2248762 RepID=UPI000E284275|nr:helix-turn-helix transcriptional regulator [Lewinella sp. IMCC34183]
MNDFTFARPSDTQLREWVDTYFYLDIPVADLLLAEEQVFPFPRITFGYFFDHPFAVTNHSSGETRRADMVFSRIASHQLSVKPLTDRVKIVGAHLKPFALALLTETDVSALPWLIAADDLLQEHAVRLRRAIDDSATPEGMFAALEATLKAAAESKNLEVVKGAIDLIERHGGSITVAAVAAQVGTSPRTLRNHFYRTVGCSPKEYSLLVKLRQSVYQMRYSSDSLTAVSYDQNFADQAHFTHTVKKIIGTHPHRIRKQLTSFRFLQF